MKHNVSLLIDELLTAFFNRLAHFTTWGNRGSCQLMVNMGRVKGRALRQRPLLKSILCQDDSYMLAYA